MTLRNTKTLAIILTLAGFITIGAVFLSLTRPAWRHARELVTSIDAANAELSAQYESRRRLLADGRAVDARLQTLAETSSQFIPPDREIDFIEEIEAIADRNHVTHETRIGSTAHPSIAEFSKSFDLVFAGSYQDILKTLIDLERMKYLTAPIAMDIRPVSANAASLTYRGHFAIRPTDL